MKSAVTNQAEPCMIVCEVAENWPSETDDQRFISQGFGEMIATNHARGYDLHSWRLDRCVIAGRINETIIAVFTRRRPRPKRKRRAA